ncbi:MAG: hypothetical protein NZ889_00320 [Candidatus Pacearchaeota archaeon]|nr:hypothetical protein [Candidatus Pacearchaeota archaeon]
MNGFIPPFIYNVLLPFLLVFAVVFAILEKTKVLGEKRNINLIVSFCITFIFVGVPAMVNVTLRLIPVVSSIIVVLLCLLLLFGFAGLRVEENKTLRTILGVILGIALAVVVFWASGAMDKFRGTKISEATLNYIIFFSIFVLAIVVVLVGGKKRE